jgi:hypothetical protein
VTLWQQRPGVRRDDFGPSGARTAPLTWQHSKASAVLRIIDHALAFPITLRQNQNASVASLRSVDRLPENSDRFRRRITDRFAENPHWSSKVMQKPESTPQMLITKLQKPRSDSELSLRSFKFAPERASTPRCFSSKSKRPDLIRGSANLIGQLPTLPHTRACSTIGAEGLNFRVRDGNGWDPLAMVTQSRL